MDLTWWL